MPGKKRTPAQLSLVGKPQDSEPDTRTATQKRSDNLAKARAKREENRAKARAESHTGPTNLERYRDGEYPVEEWTDEEISKGRPYGKNDEFGSQFPRLTGRQHSEIKRELLKRGQSKIDSMYMDALDALHDVALNGDSDAARAKAADLLIQRTAGKVPDRIEIKSSDPWQDILDEVLSDDVLERVQDSTHSA